MLWCFPAGVRGVVSQLPSSAARSQLATWKCCLWCEKVLKVNMREHFPQNLGRFGAVVSAELDKQWNCISRLQDLVKIRHFGAKAALQ